MPRLAEPPIISARFFGIVPSNWGSTDQPHVATERAKVDAYRKLAEFKAANPGIVPLRQTDSSKINTTPDLHYIWFEFNIDFEYTLPA